MSTRRGFLQLLGAVGGAVAFPAVLEPVRGISPREILIEDAVLKQISGGLEVAIARQLAQWSREDGKWKTLTAPTYQRISDLSDWGTRLGVGIRLHDSGTQIRNAVLLSVYDTQLFDMERFDAALAWEMRDFKKHGLLYARH